MDRGWCRVAGRSDVRILRLRKLRSRRNNEPHLSRALLRAPMADVLRRLPLDSAVSIASGLLLVAPKPHRSVVRDQPNAAFPRRLADPPRGRACVLLAAMARAASWRGLLLALRLSAVGARGRNHDLGVGLDHVGE